MKKLMFAAALAATGMTFADTPAGQVYDVSLSIKSTKAAKATINNKTNPFLGEDKEEVIYRTQTTYTWKGLIWGCSCEAIDGVWEEAYEGEMIDYSSIKGCILWDTKAKEAVYIGNGADINDPESAIDKGFGWDFINAIDKTGKKVEGSWVMEQEGELCDEDATLFAFRGAGFGTLYIQDLEDCGGNYIKSISGNFAGWMIAPDETAVVNPTGCTFCGYEPGSSSCEPSAAWDYCTCLDIADADRTAAYGTWKISYNSGLSKKLSQPLSISKKGVEGVIVSITDVYNFKSLPLVAAKITAIENAIWQYDPTGCDKLEQALALAKQNTYAKEQALEAVSYENLKKAVATAEVALDKAEYAQYASETNYAAKVVAWQNATNALAIAQASTNQDWTITWKNSSQDMKTAEGKGTDSMIAKFAALKTFTIDEATYGNTIFINDVEKNATATCTELNKAVETAEKNLVTATAAKTAAAAAVKAADAEVVKAQDDLTARKNNLANINLLQYKAEQDLEKAQAAEAVAQKAYDDNPLCAD